MAKNNKACLTIDIDTTHYQPVIDVLTEMGNVLDKFRGKKSKWVIKKRVISFGANCSIEFSLCDDDGKDMATLDIPLHINVK